MSERPLVRARLAALMPPLLEGQALVALVPVTGDRRWAAAAAWDVARAATLGGARRVALVDCFLDEPRLHEPAGLAPTDGIVDAFEYGVSLTKAAHEKDHVFFIGAGSHTERVADLFAHPRWPKLHAGFRSEGALLLLYCSALNLARLSARPDGVLILAPEGVAVAAPDAATLAGIGAPLLGVVRERWSAPPPAPITTPRTSRPVPPPVTPRRAEWGALTGPLVLALALAAGWALLARSAERPKEAAAPLPAPVPVTVAPVVARVDSLPWTVQLAAYGTVDKAAAQAAHVGSDSVPVFVTPIASGRRGAVWYRVLVGAYPTRAAAATARDRLWAQGLAARGEGDLLRAPWSLALDGAASRDSLRRLGLPAVAWSAARVLVGAFETPDQAGPAQAQLERAGIKAALVTRTGKVP
ncbi:MAG TPA: SPOR domain-containing protein [Gemmatimonadales bacterium]|nr:SPOR domain-containing protein [Gemmatimonadales bacterium]